MNFGAREADEDTELLATRYAWLHHKLSMTGIDGLCPGEVLA